MPGNPPSLMVKKNMTAATLVQKGLKQGDRVSTYLDKTIEALVALYAVWTAGGVAAAHGNR